jgi:hypothetical protein
MFKTHQYATNDEKVFVRLKHASMKDVQTRLHGPNIGEREKK